MKLLHAYLSDIRTYLACSIAAAALVLGGCGPQEADAAAAVTGGAHERGSPAAGTTHTHDDPNETCFICDASKREKGRLWCREHARYEDRCWLCHPELEDKERLYCKEHALYEDECFLCHPELKAGSTQATEAGGKAPASAALFCNEHRVPESECAICQPDLAASLAPGGNLKVRFPSAEAADKVGIRTGRPRISETTPVIPAFCEAQYNLNTMARIAPLAGGLIREVRHDVGDRVQAGEVLVELHSAEIAAVKSDFLSAIVERDIRRQAFERAKQLKEQNISAGKDFIEAEAAFRTADIAVSNLRQKLINFGLMKDEIARIESEQGASAKLIIRAPFSGTLVERAAVVGEAVEAGHALYTIADLSTRWLALSIPADHIGQVRLGQIVDAEFPDLPGVKVRGRVTWVDTSVDSRSRMVRARALVTDGAGMIKTGMFGEARIRTGDTRPAAIVPRDAVQRHEGGAFVFVRDEPDLFALRRVALGEASGDEIAVVAGLEPGDPVVTEGSFIVMSEFLKSRLGAGCVDH